MCFDVHIGGFGTWIQVDRLQKELTSVDSVVLILDVDQLGLGLSNTHEGSMENRSHRFARLHLFGLCQGVLEYLGFR